MSPTLFSSFVKNPANTSYLGEDHDETVHLIVRRSLYTMIPIALISIIFMISPFFFIPYLKTLKIEGIQVFNSTFIFLLTVTWYFLTISTAFQAFITWFFEALIVTNKKILDLDRGYRSISETILVNVQDITSNIHGTISEVLNIGSIFIQTAAEAEEFEFYLCDNPSLVRDSISDLVANAKQPNQL